ncbi:MAG: GNAT family N-acetyltransferase [Methanopyri archaeon]|nr:GNAT family N-acetyltransferase [Methanopyri archaeon]
MRIEVERMQFSITPATRLDYRFCYRLTKRNMLELFNRHWGGWEPGRFRIDFDLEGTRIIRHGSRRVAYFTVRECPTSFYVDNMQISGRYRGKGLGSCLMGLIEERAAQEEMERVQLTVFKENRAKRLYQRLGYRVVQDKGTSVLMEKPL